MTTSESFRKDVAQRLDRLLNSSDLNASANFPSCLSAEERKYVHHIAEQFGFQHKSTGKGDARYITVFRDPAKVGQRGLQGGKQGEDAPFLRLPAGAWEALKHPLVLHATQAGNLEALAKGAPLLAVGPAEVVSLLGYEATAARSGGRREASAASVRTGPPDTPLLQARQRLPVWAQRAEVLAAIASHQVTIVTGETGCGKSTQVPQFLVEDSGPSTSVIVTQPRRISALGLAHRVAQERGERVGRTVGYSVHLDSESSEATQLLFCTTGVFRRRFLADTRMEGVTHLVLDELHERDKVTDFLLIAIRDLLEERRDLKLVLMSATMQHDTFREYFPGCAEVHVPGRVFPVTSYFLEDLAPLLHGAGAVDALGPGFAAGGLGYGTWGDKGNEKSFKLQVLVTHAHSRDRLCGFGYNARKPLSGKRLEEGLFLHDVLQQTKGVLFDLPVIEALLEALLGDAQAGGDLAATGSVIVFLPGWDDIDRLKKRLRMHHLLGDAQRFWVLPLHGQIRLEQQREVFKTPPSGVRKIILSTNIAETSITIDDVRVVVDCGRAKETSYDAFLHVPTLNTSWISRASVEQRAGRAGRTAPGLCYRLFSRRRAELLDEHRPPEMLRSALDDVCLHAKLVLARNGESEVSAVRYLSRAPTPPEVQHILDAEILLQEIGALTSGEASGQLTPLGVHLSALPLPPQLAKIVIWANLLGVGDGALAIVSALQYRDPFMNLGDAQQGRTLGEANKAVRRAKRSLCGATCSDHIALLQAFERFEAARSRGGDAAKEFCDSHSLSIRQMQNLRQTSTKLQRELRQRKLWSANANSNKGDTALLAAALCAGLFPNVALLPPGRGGKMQVNNGRLEALPHPASVACFIDGGKDFWGSWGSSTAQHVDEEGQPTEAAAACWLCFNELTQVEDHYSVSGVTPVPASALLLLCGEGDLVVREVDLPDGSAPDEDTPDVLGQPSEGSPSCSPSRRGTVVVTLTELGSWLALRMQRETAERLQALRAMLRLLFRVGCGAPEHLATLGAEGKVGAVVLQLASQIIREDRALGTKTAVNGSAGGPSTGSQNGVVSKKGRSPRSAHWDGHGAAAGSSRDHAGASPTLNGKSRSAGLASAAPLALQEEGPSAAAGVSTRNGLNGASSKQVKEMGAASRSGEAGLWQCDYCSKWVGESDGCRDPSTGQWFCFTCWEAYYLEQQQQLRQHQAPQPPRNSRGPQARQSWYR